MDMIDLIETVIVGGGPSGLSAALILGRCTRKVLIFDDGNYRNHAVSSANGILGNDGIHPEELRAKARKDLEKYDVKIINSHVHNIRREKNYFIVEYEAYTVRAKTVILATGLKDQLPEIPGLKEAYGKKIYHCEICEAFEYRNKRIAIHGKNGINLCLSLRTWTKDLVWFSEGEPSEEDRKKAENKNIKIVSEQITSVNLESVKNSNNIKIRAWWKIKEKTNSYDDNSKSDDFDAMFLSLTKGQKQRSSLAEKLGLKVTKENGIETNDKGETEIPGLFCAGDCSRDRLLVIIGAAEGVETAINVNKYLRENWDE